MQELSETLDDGLLGTAMKTNSIPTVCKAPDLQHGQVGRGVVLKRDLHVKLGFSKTSVSCPPPTLKEHS